MISRRINSNIGAKFGNEPQFGKFKVTESPGPAAYDNLAKTYQDMKYLQTSKTFGNNYKA